MKEDVYSWQATLFGEKQFEGTKFVVRSWVVVQWKVQWDCWQTNWDFRIHLCQVHHSLEFFPHLISFSYRWPSLPHPPGLSSTWNIWNVYSCSYEKEITRVCYAYPRGQPSQLEAHRWIRRYPTSRPLGPARSSYAKHPHRSWQVAERVADCGRLLRGTAQSCGRYRRYRGR